MIAHLCRRAVQTFGIGHFLLLRDQHPAQPSSGEVGAVSCRAQSGVWKRKQFNTCNLLTSLDASSLLTPKKIVGADIYNRNLDVCRTYMNPLLTGQKSPRSMQLAVLRLPKRLQEDRVFRQSLWNFEEFISAIVLECPFQKIRRRCWPTAQLSAPE